MNQRGWPEGAESGEQESRRAAQDEGEKKMSVRIRLKRTGTRNASCFRVVVMDKRSQRDGRSIEEIGFYNPNSKVENIDLERFEYWVKTGAIPSETVNDIVYRAKNGIVLADKVRKPSVSKKAQAKAEAEAKAKAEAEAKAAEEAAAKAAEAEAAPAEA